MRLVFLSCLVAVATVASAQSAMDLNRSGRWAEASEVAARAVADESSPLMARCEALYSLIYADTQLGRAAAAEHLATFDRTCAETVAGTWVETEMDRLRPRSGPVETAPDDWEEADPASLGPAALVLAEHRALCERSRADACLVVHGGQIVQEWYGPEYADPVEAMSSTKSVAGLLAGMLVGDGKLSPDDPISRFVPEWAAGVEGGGVTVHHLLTMTSGLLGSHAPRPTESTVGGVSDKDSLVFGLPLVSAPGAEWAYSNEGAYLLSPVLRRAAGEPLEDYAARRLFGPLGMRSTRLRVYPEGQAWTHATMWTTPRDLARVGRLMLQRGRWDGEQIVSESWVEASVRPSQALNPDYGLLWWLDVPGGFAARGAYGTNVYVFPDWDLIVVRMQSGSREGATPYEPEALGLFEQFATE